MLVKTIRDEIASCSEKAYDSLPITNAKNLLFLDSDRAVVEFAKKVSTVISRGRTLLTCRQREWTVKDGRIYFPDEGAEKEVLDSNMLIDRTIHYAQELETIV